MPVTPGAPVVSNAGPLITLAKLNLLYLLQALYERVHVPQSVYEKTVIEGLNAGYKDARTLVLFLRQTEWPIQEIAPGDIPADLWSAPLDRGERDTLAIALMLRVKLVLIDETVARGIARQHGLAVRGSLGILIQAYRQRIIGADQLRFYLAEIVRRQDIWVNPALVERLRREVLGE